MGCGRVAPTLRASLSTARSAMALHGPPLCGWQAPSAPCLGECLRLHSGPTWVTQAPPHSEPHPHPTSRDASFWFALCVLRSNMRAGTSLGASPAPALCHSPGHTRSRCHPAACSVTAHKAEPLIHMYNVRFCSWRAWLLEGSMLPPGTHRELLSKPQLFCSPHG